MIADAIVIDSGIIWLLALLILLIILFKVARGL